MRGKGYIRLRYRVEEPDGDLEIIYVFPAPLILYAPGRRLRLDLRIIYDF